jgi:DNA-binding cell septation regulator SpoVG
MIKISEVQISFIKPKDGLVAFASCVVNDSIFLSSIAIHKKLCDDSYRVTYPKKGNFSLFHPIKHEASTEIEDKILKKLKDVMSKVNHDRYNCAQN